MEQIPQTFLRERLQRIKSQKTDFLAAFRLFTEDFLQEVSDMAGNTAAVRRCCEKISSYDHSDGKAKTLTEMVEIADSLPETEKTELLCSLLVIPFAGLEDERRKQDGHEFFNAGYYERNQ